MTTAKRALAVIPVMVAAITMTAGSAHRSESPCEVATRWVNAHASALPTTLAAISAYPSLYRRIAFAALSREAQLSLFHEQLQHYITSAGLTRRQKSFLIEVNAELDRYFDAGVADARYRVRAQEVLGRELARMVFAEIGVHTAESAKGGSEGEKGTNSKAPFFGCTCSTSSDWCGDHTSCTYSFGGCDRTTLGCGTLLLYDCDGMCTGNGT